jgi:hypothetical protein
MVTRKRFDMKYKTGANMFFYVFLMVFILYSYEIVGIDSLGLVAIVAFLEYLLVIAVVVNIMKDFFDVD